MKSYSIAISGLPGSGSTTTAKLIAEKLSLNYFSPGRLFKDIAMGKVTEQHYYNIFKLLCDEKSLVIPKFNNSNDSKAAKNLWQTEFGQSKEFHNIIDELQIKLADKGNIIVDGKLSINMLKNTDLKIWFKASLDERIKRTAKRDSLDVNETKEILTIREEKEHHEWKKIYGFDYLEQEKQADLVIDTTNLTPEQIIKKIINHLNQ